MAEQPDSACTPIGVFWDIENCHVPRWKSALHVVQAIRDRFFTGHREAEFMCVCDTAKQSKHVIQELNQAQINVVHIDALSKNAADDKLRQNIRRFSDTQTPPATILLISSDVNFSSDLYDLRYRKNFHIVVIHREQAHDALILSATEHHLYDDIVADIPCRATPKPLDEEVELRVTGFSSDLDPRQVKVALKQMSSNTGGKVVAMTTEYATIRFSSQTVAERARHRMEGQQLHGNNIHLDFVPRNPTYNNKPGTTQDANNNDTKAGGVKSKYTNNNVSPKRNRPYSQRKISPKAAKPTAATDNKTGNPGQYPGVTAPGESNQNDHGIQDVVKKFAGDNKSSRHLLMLQQQLYQEEQAPSPAPTPPPGQAPPNTSTQFYSHVTKYEETSYYGYGGGHQHNQQQRNYGNQWHHSGAGGGGSSYQGADNSRYQQQYSGGGGGYGGQSNYGTQGSYQYQSQYQPPSLPYPPGSNNKGFWPIRSASPSEGSLASGAGSPCELDGEVGPPGSVELVVSNLDYNISPREWKHILMTTFHPHVKIVQIDVSLQPDNTSLGFIRVGSVEEARFAISQFHRKKIGYKRIHVTLKTDEAAVSASSISVEEARFAISQFCRKKIGYKRIDVTLKTDEAALSASSIRSEAIALLSEAKGNVLPLFKFIELFNKRFNRSVSVSELYKMKDTIEIREQGGSGRMIHLVRSLVKSPATEEPGDGEVQEILEQVVCSYHCPEGSVMYAEAVNTTMLPNVRLQLKTFSAQLHSLLMSHDGNIPLMSFPACFSAEVCPLTYVYEGGVPLEHVISSVPGVQIVVSGTGTKKISWAENKPPSSPDLSRQCSSPLLAQQLSQFGRDVTELLKSSPQCRLAFSNFIPTYHHFFGRQCRVADYGYSKLTELFEAVQHIVQVLGSGDRKCLTLTHRAQTRRFTADLIRLLKSLPGKLVYLATLTDDFSRLLSRSWDITEYGVWCVEDMLTDLPAGTVDVTTEGNNTIISLPRKDQTSEELERTKQFSLEVVDLLKHSHQFRMLFNKFIPAYHHHYQTSEELERTKQFSLEVVDLLKHSHQFRMLFNKFIPAYHHHFGRQCRVSDYGFTKLLDLFEAIPHIIELGDEEDEKVIRLTEPELRKVVGEQVVGMLRQQKVACLPLDTLVASFSRHYGFSVPLADFNVNTVDELVAKLKHALKVEVYDSKTYVVLADRSSAPPLARQVLQLLMDQSGGSLPLMELCSRYMTTFGVEPDVAKIKEELLDYVVVSGDDESGVISLTALQTLARDIRILLQAYGKVSLASFERLYQEKFCTEIKPALYGFPTLVALLMAIPHVVSIKGKGNRRVVHLSGDLQGSLPIIDESYTRPDSDTPSNDSGSALTDEETPTEGRGRSPLDLLGGLVPSGVPSPGIVPSSLAGQHDLINLDSPTPDLAENLLHLTEEERRSQKSPLCRTPTSHLLHMAAQFLPASVESPSAPGLPAQSLYQQAPGQPASYSPAGPGEVASQQSEPRHDPSQEIMDLLKHKWWHPKPSPLSQQQHPGEAGSEGGAGRGVARPESVSSIEASDIINTTEAGVHHLAQGHMNSYTAQQTIQGQTSLYTTQQTLQGQDANYMTQQTTQSQAANYTTTRTAYQEGKANGQKIMQLLDCKEDNKVSTVEEKRVEAGDPSVSAGGETAGDAGDQPPITPCPRPLQPGSYWYSKLEAGRQGRSELEQGFGYHGPSSEIELPSTSPDDVRRVLGSLIHRYSPHPRESRHAPGSYPTKHPHDSVDNFPTPTQSIDISESLSMETITETSKETIKVDKPDTYKPDTYKPDTYKPDTYKPDTYKPDTYPSIPPLTEAEVHRQATKAVEKALDHKLGQCVAEDCMCYEAVFRQDQPLDTSSIKSGSSAAPSPVGSPRRKVESSQPTLSTSSLSDDSNNSSLHRKKSRIAARFGQPIESQ